MIVLRRVTLPSAGLYPVASVAFAGIAYGGATTAHGSGFLAVFLAGLVIGSGSSPARRTIITFHEGLAWVAQLGALPAARPVDQPARADRVHPRGHRDRHRHRRDRAAAGGAAGGLRLHRARAADAGLGGPARSDPDRVRHLPGHRGHRARRDDLPGRVLRRAALHDPAGPDDRAGRALARRDLRRGRDPGPAGRARDPQPAGRRDDAVPRPSRRRDRGPPGPRARPPARGAAQRHRARRTGDPAQRLDGDHRGRPTARARAPGGRGGLPRPDAPLAHRAGRPARAPEAPAPLAVRRSPRSARGSRGTATRSARRRSPGSP